jgi:hypothetical protein
LGRRNGPLSGHIAVREPYLRFGLNDHPTVGWQDPEDPAAPKLYELEFVKSGFLSPGTEEERKAGRKARPLIQIDYRRYLAAGQEPGVPAVSSKEPSGIISPRTSSSTAPQPTAQQEKVSPENAVLKDLQRQVKELTESNQELRAKLKELSERRDQNQAQSNATVEELAGLRQELAETKQLLADKVLELNRLQKKSGGTNEGKQ